MKNNYLFLRITRFDPLWAACRSRRTDCTGCHCHAYWTALKLRKNTHTHHRTLSAVEAACTSIYIITKCTWSKTYCLHLLMYQMYVAFSASLSLKTDSLILKSEVRKGLKLSRPLMWAIGERLWIIHCSFATCWMERSGYIQEIKSDE